MTTTIYCGLRKVSLYAQQIGKLVRGVDYRHYSRSLERLSTEISTDFGERIFSQKLGFLD
jgi:hypothetical protein